MGQLVGPLTSSVNVILLVIAIASALGALIVAAYVAGHPFIPEDAVVERDIQSTDWGPLALTFPIFSWIGDAKGAILEAVVFIAVLVWNRRAWILAAAAALTGGWYVLLSHVIVRARPTTAQVLRVTEHPAASSFPSGHTIFVATLATVLMLCLARPHLPRWGRPIGWAVVGLTVIANGISRIYTGAHWPTDVLGGILIAVAWLAFVVSLRWISDRALAT